MKSLVFFNHKGGVGKTSLVYHLGWKFADLGLRVLLVDFDPQSNLTAMCVDEDRLQELWIEPESARKTIRGALQPIIEGLGDIQQAHLEELTPRLALLPGDIRLSDFESRLSDAWPRCLDRDPAAFRTVSSLYRIVKEAGSRHEADLLLIDVGPNLGAINRSALLVAEHVITPIGADLFSLQGLRNLGPTLEKWRSEWGKRLEVNPVPDLDLPPASIQPAGYVVMQPNLYGGQVTKAYNRWLNEIPAEYNRSILGREERAAETVANDPHCLAVLRHYRSLMPLAQSARKPIFKLTAADGAIGAHWDAVQEVGWEFRRLAWKIAGRIGLDQLTAA